jgi:hypothetical protein
MACVARFFLRLEKRLERNAANDTTAGLIARKAEGLSGCFFVVRFFVVRPLQSRFPQSRASTESTLFWFFLLPRVCLKGTAAKNCGNFRESCYFRLWH